MSGILSAFIGRVAGVVTDAYFNLVTLLLPGNGTNGAQNNTFLDSSSNNFTITRNGNTTQGTFSPFSQTGWSNFFNGSSDYLNAPAGSAFAFGTGSWTVEAWVYVTSLASEILLFDTRSSVSTAGVGCRIATDGTLSYSGSANNALTTTAITTNTWNHVAFVYDGTTLSGYINGSRGGTATPSFNITQNNGVIGRVGFSASGYMAGYISNLRVVKGTAVYSGSSFTVPTAALTAITNTSLLTCQSNRFIDNSSNAFAITVNSTPSIQAFSPFAPTAAYSAATVGGSGYFDGSGDYLTYTTPSTVVREWWVNDFTVEAWIYPTTLTGWDYSDGGNRISTVIGNASPTATNNFWSFGPINTGAVKLYYFNGSAGISVTSTETVKVNQWNHIAFTKTSGGATLFVNGVGTTTTALNGTPQSGNTFPLTVGQINNTSCNGYISAVRILNGTAQYSGTTYTIPTIPPTAITNTSFLLNFTNAGITDATAKNDLETVGNAQISTTQSKFGGSSMYFDGTGDYLFTPANQSVAFGTGDFTVEAWVYVTTFTTTTGFQAIFSNRNSSSAQASFDFGIRNSDKYLYFYNRNTDTSTFSTSGLSGVNTWIHVAIVRSGSTITFYINGSSAGTVSVSTNSFGTNNVIYVGSNFNTTPDTFNGYIDDLRVTKFARTITAAPTAAFPLQ